MPDLVLCPDCKQRVILVMSEELGETVMFSTDAAPVYLPVENKLVEAHALHACPRKVQKIPEAWRRNKKPPIGGEVPK